MIELTIEKYWTKDDAEKVKSAYVALGFDAHVEPKDVGNDVGFVIVVLGDISEDQGRDLCALSDAIDEVLSY